MNRVKTIGLVASHIVFGIIGIILASRDSDSVSDLSKTPSHTKTDHALSTERSSDSTVSQRPLKEWRSSEHAQAWNAIRYAKLNTNDRIQTQRELLKSWAKVDLVAAMRAALDEAWDNDDMKNYRPNGPIIDAFAEAFGQHPEESWNLICHGGFGIGSSLLRNVWIRSVGQKDPMYLASIFKDLSQSDRDKAVNTCLSGASFSKDKTMLKQVFEHLSSLPADIVSSKQLAGFLTATRQNISISELRTELFNSENSDDRLAGAKAVILGIMLARTKSDEIARSIADLPGKHKQEILWSAITSGLLQGGEKFTGVVDQLIAENAWDKLNQRELGPVLHMASMGCDAQHVANWATTLPYRQETTQMFHRGIENHIRYNMEASKEWIASIPTQEWRDRAYAEYSQQALDAKNDPTASRWALDQIQDSNFKAEAEGWRTTWEKENTPTNK